MTAPAPFGDPHYVPRLAPPEGGTTVRLGGVDVTVVITDTDPTSAAAQWAPDRAVTLALTDDLAPELLAGVLTDFVAYAAGHTDGRDTAAELSLPSRDVDRALVARAAGFVPTAALAVADLRRPPGADRPRPDGLHVRDAVLDDALTVGRLWCEQAEYEARVGTLRLSPAIRAAIVDEAALCVAGTGDVLVAERDGAAVGVVIASDPTASAWSSARLAFGPACYLGVASTASGARGGGVGAALVAELHARHRAAGVAASTLHWSVLNPLSVPFWCGRGYRPLVTSYSRRVT